MTLMLGKTIDGTFEDLRTRRAFLPFAPIMQVHMRCHFATSRSLKSAGEKRGPDDQSRRLIGRTKGGPNTKPHADIDAKGGPVRSFMTAYRCAVGPNSAFQSSQGRDGVGGVL
ncbi:hypothetical protein GCM10017056_08560 [Seohaeicola zhoushanensis]|uniref:Uncharacterized protein n=1 Tax=Seohaeicola zhoushanensis TaxID=1569283 RepID=A0A8J3GUD5_9RHOB|nr:hypothetical protein GCM10017056_08560 [Seohaeicola zhoushanensis]